jgi:hypothetical protein
MSHLVTIQTKIHDPAAVRAACRRLGLAEPAEGTTRLYSGEATTAPEALARPEGRGGSSATPGALRGIGEPWTTRRPTMR